MRVVDDLAVATVGLDAIILDADDGVPPVVPRPCDAIEEVVDHLEAGDVDCAVVGGSAATPDAVGRLRSADTVLPILAVGGDDDADLLGAGATDHLPAGADDATVAARARSAAARGHRLAWHRRDSRALESVLHESPTYLDVKDTETRHVRVNHPGRNAWMLGLTTRERWADDSDVAGDVGEESHEQETAVLEREQSFVNVEDADRTEDGTLVAYRWSKWPWYRDDGTVGGVVRHVVDVSDLRQREEELVRKNSRLEEVASTVAHDLRNPLMVALGNADLLAEDVDDERVDAIVDALDRIDEIVTDTLESARGGHSRHREPVTLVDSVEQAWATVVPGDAAIETDLPPTATVNAERGRLRQLFENLFRNALEHAGEDVEIRVGLLRSNGVGDGFYVEDDGPGFPGAVTDRDGVLAGDNEEGFGLNIVELVAGDHDWSVTYCDGDAGGARIEVAADVVTAPPPATDAGQPLALSAGADVGDPSVRGHADREDDRVELHGGGWNVWRDSCEGHLLGARARGDWQVTTRVADLAGPNRWSKGGIAVVDDAGDPTLLGAVTFTRDNGTEVLWREDPDGGVTSTQLGDGATLPTWLRLTRHGQVVTASTSDDGQGWHHVSQRHLPLEETATVGLFGTAVNEVSGPNDTVEVVFEDVAATGTPAEEAPDKKT